MAMLQQKTAAYEAIETLRREGRFQSCSGNPAQLETATDRFIADMRRIQSEAAWKLGGIYLIAEIIQSVLRTDTGELMDDPSLPLDKKLRMSRALGRQSGMLRLTERFVDLLSPIITELAERNGRDTRVLELAGGAGSLSLALGRAARNGRLPCRVTGTDIVDTYTKAAQEEADEEGLPAEFHTLDACRMDKLERGSADLVVISQSLHHFSPGQLALMIRGAKEAGASAFIGLDGYRSLLLSAGVPLVAAMQGIWEFALDGLTSARKFYTEPELDAISEIATTERNHLVLTRWPLTLLLVRFDGIGAAEASPPYA
jgi:SAM-dependent methyltransferase